MGERWDREKREARSETVRACVGGSGWVGEKDVVWENENDGQIVGRKGFRVEIWLW